MNDDPHLDDPSLDNPSFDETRRTTVKRGPSALLFVAGLIGLTVMIAVATSGSSTEERPGLTDIEFTTLDGGTGTLDDYAGQPMMVNFFAGWCPPCRAELPDIEQVHRDLGDDITILGVSRDNTESAWKGLLVEYGLTYPTVFEGIDGRLFEAAGGFSMPTTVFISPDGEIVHTAMGLQSESSLRELIDIHLME